MRKIGVVTVARSDFGIYLPVLRAISAAPDLELLLIVAGAHLSPEFGKTVDYILADGFQPSARVEMLLSSDSPEGIAKSMGLGIIGFSQAYAQLQPDILLVLGDRFEMHAAVAAAAPFKIPVAHIHGGEETQGAIDNTLRHSITKLSHLHFPATEEYAGRIIQMGEEPWRVTVSGAPGLDNLKLIQLLSREQMSARYELDLSFPPIIVTYHPVTLEFEQAEWQTCELLTALDTILDEVPSGIVFTMPNADTNGRIIQRMIREFLKSHPRARAFDNLGTQGYFSLMHHALIMIGNSSSGIIEAASFKLPVVNIGIRQYGRTRPINVVDSSNHRDDILAAARQVLTPEFRDSLADLVNPYGQGNAAGVIVEKLCSVNLGEHLLRKPFYSLEQSRPGL